MDSFAASRAHLVEILRHQGISDEAVLAAIGRVKREAFVPAGLAAQAYENVALPIGHRQTISQPFIVAAMTQALGLHERSRVLEVGTGSGYQAAILAEIAGSVVSVERVPELLESARVVLISATAAGGDPETRATDVTDEADLTAYVEQFHGAGQQLPPDFIQAQGLPHPVEQLQAELALELAQRCAGRRLRQRNFFGSTRDISVARDRDKDFELSEGKFHISFLDR